MNNNNTDKINKFSDMKFRKLYAPPEKFDWIELSLKIVSVILSVLIIALFSHLFYSLASAATEESVKLPKVLFHFFMIIVIGVFLIFVLVSESEKLSIKHFCIYFGTAISLIIGFSPFI